MWHIFQLWAEVWENRSSHHRREPDLRTDLLVGQIYVQPDNMALIRRRFAFFNRPIIPLAFGQTFVHFRTFCEPNLSTTVSKRGQTPKSGRSQTNTRCVDDRTGVSGSDIHEHAVASGRRFRSTRRRRSLSGPVEGGAGGTRFFLVDIRRHARFWVGPPTAERFD